MRERRGLRLLNRNLAQNNRVSRDSETSTKSQRKKDSKSQALKVTKQKLNRLVKKTTEVR